jgi:hypothetical protein
MATSSLPPGPDSPAAAVPRPRRRWWVGALVVLAWLAALGAARQWTARRLIATRDADAVATPRQAPNFYTLIARQHHRDAPAFASRAAQVMADTMRQSPEHVRLAIDDRATVADVGPTLRVAIGYRGPVNVDEGRARTVDGEVRQYFHARGVDVIHVTCLTESGPCVDRASLLAQAEQALLERLDDTGPVGILPDGGRCDASRQDIVGAAAHTMTCVYGGRLELGLRRMTDKDTRHVVSALAEDPAARDLLERQP